MFFRFLLILVLSILQFNLFAINVSGKAEGFENKFIRLYAVSDFISYKENKLDVVKISNQGEFSLNGYIIQAGLIKIRIEDKSLDLVVLADSDLQIDISFDELENQARLYDKSLNVKVLNNSDQGINALIFEYQKLYAAFIEENQVSLVTKNILPKVHLFQTEMKEKYRSAPAYFQAYLEYDLAALEDAVLGSEKKLFVQQIKNRPILYDNMAFMKFFEQFYQERFIQISQGKKGFDMLSAVNGTQNYDRMMEIVREHEFIDNDTLAQLFVILGLKEVYGDETFKKDKVLSMLKIVQDRALNYQHERMAQNVISENTFMKKGQSAPIFSLKDKMGKVHHLNDYQQKTILLFFWSAYSTVCLRDFEYVKEYQNKYGSKLEILAVNMDDDPAKALLYISKNEFSVVQLFKDNQYDLIDKYRLYSVPTYALLDKDLKIIKYPANRPENNLEGEIFRLISKD